MAGEISREAWEKACNCWEAGRDKQDTIDVFAAALQAEMDATEGMKEGFAIRLADAEAEWLKKHDVLCDAAVKATAQRDVWQKRAVEAGDSFNRADDALAEMTAQRDVARQALASTPPRPSPSG